MHRRTLDGLHPQFTPAAWGWLFCLVIVLIAGCASQRPSIDTARNAFAAGDLATARSQLTAITAAGDRYSVAGALDLAMVELAAGDHQSAEQRLRKLRDHFESLPKLAPISEAAAIATDDTRRVFRPAGYEEVMTRTMLALCSLAGDASDAESYSLQAIMKQNELATAAADRGIADAAKLYQPIAIAPYLRGVIREATHRDYDDAAKAYQLVSSVRPDFVPAAADIQRASVGTHSAPGHGVLYVLACVGRGPELWETTAPTTSTALTIASAALQADEKQGDAPALPNVASVKIPTVVIPPSRVAAVDVRVDGQLYGTTQTLTDVGSLAANQVAAEMPWTIARAVVRRVTKEATVSSVANSLGIQGTASSLFRFAAASAWSGSENADTRCWGLLPREIQVLRAELPVGTHAINISAVGTQGEAYADHRRTVNITNGRNHYLITIAPDQALYVIGMNSP